MADKQGLRREYLDKRRSLTSNQIDEESLRLCEMFKDFFGQSSASSVHVFLPIKKHHEVNTWPVIEFLRSHNAEIIVSKSDFDHLTLSHYYLEESTDLEENKWGIPEPVNARPAAIENIKMVLVPLVIFDVHGYRVGYGKGFYDKFLSSCPEGPTKVGLSLFPPVDDIRPDEHDVKLDFCITPNQIHRF